MNTLIRYMGLHTANLTVQCVLMGMYLAREEYALSALFGASSICGVALGRIAWKHYRASIADGRIQPAPVKRDADGYWTHPAFPSFDEGQSAAASAWYKSQQLETSVAYLESDDDAQPSCVSYWGDDDAGIDISAWQPPKPKGWGWFILSIHDTEDWGPVCVWVRHSSHSSQGARRQACAS